MDQLRIGLYVYLDLTWFQHPFAFSHFKIKSEDQIKTILGLGLKSVRYDPALSDPVSSKPAETQPRPDQETAPDFITQALSAKRAMMERIRVQREAAGGRGRGLLHGTHAKRQRLQAPVQLARLMIFGALNWSVQWYDLKKSASLDDLANAAMALFIQDKK